MIQCFTTCLTDNEAVWQSITLRAVIATLLSLALSLALGRPLIRILGKRLRERIVSDSSTIARLHQHKAATPTMGGLLVVAIIIATVLLLGDGSHGTLPAVLLLLVGLTAVGASDDLLKMRRGKGLRAKEKLAGQLAVAAVAVSWAYWSQSTSASASQICLPGIGTIDLGLAAIPLGMLVVVGSSNAVNLTDGLDGLAGGCLLLALTALGIVCSLVGDANLASYCGVLHVPAAKDMTIVCGAGVGALLGFLWYNRHPARIFLGDTGSLPLGGLLALVAFIARQELTFMLIAGVFVAEAGSVIIQVGFYKLRQRRIFLCAPLHHHFQFLGWPESKIVWRFWLAAVMCAFLGLGSLKVGSKPVADKIADNDGGQTSVRLTRSLTGAMER